MSAASADAGFRVYRNSTITKMVVTASDTANVGSTATIRYYGGATLASLEFTSSLVVIQDLNLNVDVDAGNNLFAYLSGQNANASRSYPQIIAELAWRI